jgi:hypothetical protein
MGKMLRVCAMGVHMHACVHLCSSACVLVMIFFLYVRTLHA